MSIHSSEDASCPEDAACEVLQRLWHKLDAKQADFVTDFTEMMTAVQDSHMPDTSYSSALESHRDSLVSAIDKILDFQPEQHEACMEGQEVS